MRFKRWHIAVLVILVLGVAAALSVPAIIDAQMRSKIDAKLHKAFGDRVTYARVETDWRHNHATIYDLKLLQPDPASTHNPLVQIGEAEIVFDSLTGKHANARSLKLRNCSVNAVVDAKGEASVARFIREKPQTGRTWEILVEDLSVENVIISTFIAPRNKDASETAPAVVGTIPEKPTSVLKAGSVHAVNFILPPERSLLGREHWIAAAIDNIELIPTAAGETAPEPCIKIASLKFDLAQAPATDKPVLLRNFQLHQPELITTHDAADRKSEMRVAVMSIQKAFGLKEPKEFHQTETAGRPMPAGLVIQDVHTTDARIESRGSNSDGEPAFFRLQNANVEGGNLAFGERVTPVAPGFLKVRSSTESTNGTGTAEINLTDVQGTYPKVTFHCDYRASNVTANAFTSSGAGSENARVKRGALALSFAGGANEGNLNITGSVTLSEDFDVYGDPFKKAGVKLQRGEPISPVEVTGTIEHPHIQMPSSLAMLGNILGNIALAGPVGILDSTVGQIPVVGKVVTIPVKEATRGIKKIGDFFQGK